MNRVVRTQTCSACKFSEAEAGQRFCHRMPGVASPMMMPHSGSPGGVRVGFYTCWPVVKDEEWCGEYRPRIDVAVALPEAVQRGAASPLSTRFGSQPSGEFVPGDAER